MKLRKEFKEAVQKKIPPGKMNRAVQSKDARIIYRYTYIRRKHFALKK